MCINTIAFTDVAKQENVITDSAPILLMPKCEGKKKMDKNSAKQVLECWIACPCAFSHGQCQLGEEESCEKGCWSPKQVKEAVVLLLGIQVYLDN